MAEGISTIPLPTPFAVGRVNCYLIDDEPLTLVDAGPNSEEAWQELEAGLAGLGRRVEDVGLVLLTHQHHDHIGLAAAVKRRSGAEVAASRSLARFLADFDGSMEAEDQYAAAIMALHGVPPEVIRSLRDVSRNFRQFGSSATVDRELGEGDMVELAVRRLAVHLRPGHSPTDTIFVDGEARVALVADHLMADVTPNPIVHRPPEESIDPRRRPPALARYLDSVRRTAELDLAELLPGHGPPIHDHRRLVSELIAFHERRKELMLAELGHVPKTAHALACSLWGETALQQVYLTLSEVLGHLDLLVAEGRVRELDRGDVIEFEAV